MYDTSMEQDDQDATRMPIDQRGKRRKEKYCEHFLHQEYTKPNPPHLLLITLRDRKTGNTIDTHTYIYSRFRGERRWKRCWINLMQNQILNILREFKSKSPNSIGKIGDINLNYYNITNSLYCGMDSSTGIYQRNVDPKLPPLHTDIFRWTNQTKYATFERTTTPEEVNDWHYHQLLLIILLEAEQM